jgi:hypothetical protein
VLVTKLKLVVSYVVSQVCVTRIVEKLRNISKVVFWRFESWTRMWKFQFEFWWEVLDFNKIAYKNQCSTYV